MPMRDGTAERREELYREAMALIARDYANDLQLEGVARMLATSRRQLQRAFAEIGDTSFRDELAKVRMHHARTLLAADSIPVRAVAARVGYHQPAQFAKSFRRHHGQAPSAYRKERRAGGGSPAAIPHPQQHATAAAWA
jgi:transcriptional regulator GlxA family with amidase domain